MCHSSKNRVNLLFITLFAFSCSTAFAENRFSLSVGSDFTSGKYGRSKSTDIWYVPFTARYARDRASFRVTIPYISVTGTRNILVPGDGFDGSPGSPDLDLSPGGNDPGSKTERGTASGLGDIIAAFTYNLIYHKPSRTAFNITNRIKIPTASTARRLGTGRVDYAIQGDLIKRFSKFHLRATLGYRIPGNPENIKFRNVFYGGVGLGYRLSAVLTVGTSFNISQSAVRLQDSRRLSAYFSYRINENIRLNIYGLKGFSNRSPDWGSGASLQYNF